MQRIEINVQTGVQTTIDLTAAEIAALPEPVVPTYQEQRVPEYPSIGDQLDALFHAGVFPAEMAAVIQAVKDKYPKEAK
tara:strand:- start:188 stop:424 length:237 start_codon:yes stop_codon:yes gene_type:complete